MNSLIIASLYFVESRNDLFRYEITLTGDDSDDVNYVRTEMAQRSSVGTNDFETQLFI